MIFLQIVLGNELIQGRGDIAVRGIEPRFDG